MRAGYHSITVWTFFFNTVVPPIEGKNGESSLNLPPFGKKSRINCKKPQLLTETEQNLIQVKQAYKNKYAN